MQWSKFQTKVIEIIWTTYDVKLVDISGKKGEYLKAEINKLETNSKDKNIRDL
jgi:hypothetical protein